MHGPTRSFESVSQQQCPTSCAHPWHGCWRCSSRRRCPDADSEALLSQAREQVEEMRELVDDVLFLSELESGREVVALGSTRALPVLEEVRDRLADSAERADVAIRVEADPSVELPVRRTDAADRRREPRGELDSLRGARRDAHPVGAARRARGQPTTGVESTRSSSRGSSSVSTAATGPAPRVARASVLRSSSTSSSPPAAKWRHRRPGSGSARFAAASPPRSCLTD